MAQKTKSGGAWRDGVERVLITEDQIARILSDVAWLAYRWNKPLAARLLPAPGKRAGEQTEFTGSILVKTTIQPLPGTKQ